MNLALFDFDGTLTSKDSLGEFLKYSVPRKDYLLNMFKFAPYFVMWQLKLMKNYEAKQKLFSIFYADMSEDTFKQIAIEFSTTQIDKIILEDRLNILKKHQENGDRVLIVSASIKCWLEPWCKQHNLELLSTELEFINQKYSGKFATPNCHGSEKVNRIKQLLHVKEYNIIYAYGDSSGDTQMLALADKATKY